jgi:GntR family transcriptional regulator, transcriptional repressor for pyruvate dehydrogenase complex
MKEFKKILPIKISDLIIEQIKQMIEYGIFKPGEKLPSEIKLVRQLGVKLGEVKDAFRKLEFYGILETKPQSGTFVVNFEANTLVALIDNIQTIEKFSEAEEIESLMDTRIILEMRSAELAAIRIDKDSFSNIMKAHDIYAKASSKRVNNDICFHLKIVEASKSPFLRYLITLISPKIISIIDNSESNRDKENIFEYYKKTLAEHQKIIQAIKEKNPNKAAKAMKEHLENSLMQIINK